MNKYLKILLITLVIQIGCWGIGIFLGQLPVAFASGAAVLFVLCFPISLVVDIVLAVKWGNGIKEKLICILLMPTNYTWLLVVCILSVFIKKGLHILYNLPSNFG